MPAWRPVVAAVCLAAALGQVAGCATARVTPEAGPRPTIEELDRLLTETDEALHTFRGQARLRVESGSDKLKSSQMISVRAPSAVRIDIMNPFGVSYSLASEGDRLTAVDQGESTWYRGRSDAATLAALVGVAVDPRDLVDLLRGLSPWPAARRTHGGARAVLAGAVGDGVGVSDTGGDIGDGHRGDGDAGGGDPRDGNGDIGDGDTLQAGAGDVRGEIRPGGGAWIWHRTLADGGALELGFAGAPRRLVSLRLLDSPDLGSVEADFSEHRDVDGVAVPHAIDVRWQDRAALELRYSKVWRNVTMAEGAFRIEPAPGGRLLVVEPAAAPPAGP